LWHYGCGGDTRILWCVRLRIHAFHEAAASVPRWRMVIEPGTWARLGENVPNASAQLAGMRVSPIQARHAGWHGLGAGHGARRLSDGAPLARRAQCLTMQDLKIAAGAKAPPSLAPWPGHFAERCNMQSNTSLRDPSSAKKDRSRLATWPWSTGKADRCKRRREFICLRGNAVPRGHRAKCIGLRRNRIHSITQRFQRSHRARGKLDSMPDAAYGFLLFGVHNKAGAQRGHRTLFPHRVLPPAQERVRTDSAATGCIAQA
jgi:hypothetical protein